MDIKTIQERSEQMVSVNRIGERGQLLFQYRGAAIILKDIACSDPCDWLSLQEEVGRLRAMVQAALRDYAEQTFGNKVLECLPATERHRSEASSPHSLGGNGASAGPVEVRTPARRRDKILYGLPCANCGAYFDSDLAMCPCCKHRPDYVDFAPQMSADPESCKEPFTLQ